MPFVPFISQDYVTAPNANGDYLVVGNMSLSNYFNLLSEVPLPSTPNQQFCSPIQLAPGLYARAYVPTAAERAGNFSDFQGLLRDPLTFNPDNAHGSPFPGGLIPASRIPEPFAWRIRTPEQTSSTSTGLHFVPITPCRIADTRNTGGPFGAPMLAGQTTRDFVIPDSSCGIPATAQAFSLNFTVVPSDKLSFLTVFPAGQTRPLASTLNSYDGRIKANAAIVPAGIDSAISVFATDATHLIIDINGYFVPDFTPATLAFYPLAPCRIMDTRGSAGPLGSPSLSAQQERVIPVLASSCNLPATSKAYSLNYTVVPKGPLSYLTTWPSGQTRPLVSTLNAPTGSITANAALVPAADNGDISVYVTEETDLIIDVNGFYAPPASGGLSLYNLVPCRVYDSRLQASPLAASTQATINVERSACNVPADAQSYVFNATVLPTQSLLFLTLWANGQLEQPDASALNAPDGAVTSNLAVVPTFDGSISAFASQSTHLILDIFGYFAP